MEEKKFIEPEEIKETKTLEKTQKIEFADAGPNPKKKEVHASNFDSNTNSYFDGSFFGLLAYNYLSIFITAFTAGVFKPWADCIFNKYIYSHMVIDGKRLKFEGEPADLFVNSFKWNFFRLITFGIYGIWVPTRYKEWELSYLHFEDENLSDEDSYFTGSVFEYFCINFLTTLLTVVTFGLLGPVAKIIKLRWELEHSIINRKIVSFDGSAFGFLLKKIGWTLLSIITFGIYGLFVPLKTYRWITSNISLVKKGNGVNQNSENGASNLKTNTKKNKIPGFIALGILLVLVVFIIVKIASLFGPYDSEAEAEMKNTGSHFRQEFVTNRNYAELGKEGLPKNIKKLDYESIKSFRNNGGKGFYTVDYYSDDYSSITLILYKKSTYCTVDINSNSSPDSLYFKCQAIKDYFKIRNKSAERNEMVVPDYYY